VAWVAPTKPVNWQDTPSTSTALDAANLNADEAYAATVGTSVVTYFEGGSSSTVPAVTKFLAPSGGDDSAAMQTALNLGGLIVLGPGTFLWNTQVPAFKRSTPTAVIGSGIGKTFIKLSSGAPRAFDLNKVADGDTFTGIRLADFTVDCNSIGGLHHVVIGNYQAGALQTRFNVTGLRIQRVNTINVPSQTTTGTYNIATLHRVNVHIAIVDSANQATQYSLTDVQIDDCVFGASGGGGDEGVFLGGTVASAVTGLNVWVDNCHISNSTWTSGAVPTQFFASAGFQIGSCAFGGRATINRCLALYAGDVGFENDTMMRVDHVQCEAVDCWNFGFYVRNVQYVAEQQGTPPTSGQAQTQAQQHSYMQCIARRLTVAGMRGYRIDTFNSIPLGHFVYRDCVWDRETTDFVTTAGEAWFTIGTVASALIDGFKISLPALSATGAAATVSLIAADGAGPETIKVRNTQAYLGGANTSGNTQTINVVAVFSQTVSPQTTHVEVDGLFIDPGGGTGFTSGNFAINGAVLGQSSANTTNITGTVRRLKFSTAAAFSGSWQGVIVGASSHTTINARTGIRITECDMSAVSGNPVAIGAGNLSNVFINMCAQARTTVAASTYTALNTDELIVVNFAGAVTITLPAISAAAAGKILVVQDESNVAGTNNITISRAGSDTFLGGGTTKVINTNGGTFKCYSSGSVWVPTT
jgi:hypothetical protein